MFGHWNSYVGSIQNACCILAKLSCWGTTKESPKVKGMEFFSGQCSLLLKWFTFLDGTNDRTWWNFALLQAAQLPQPPRGSGTGPHECAISTGDLAVSQRHRIQRVFGMFQIMRLKIIEPWFSMIWAYLDRFLQWFVPSTVPFHLIHLLAKTFNTLWQVRPMRWVLFAVSCLRWIGWPVDRGAAGLRSLSTPVIQTLSKRPNFRGC